MTERKIPITLICIFAFAGSVFGAGPVEKDPSPVTPSPGEAYGIGKKMEILVNMFRDITLYYVDPVDPETLLANAAAGLTYSLDPYSEYYGKEDSENFQMLTTGRYAGIGSIIGQKGEYVYFSEPYKNSPADKAGIRMGDKLLEIDGKDMRGMGVADVSAALKGEAGSVINVKVQRFYTDAIEEIAVRRELITVPAIPYYGMLDGNIGYIMHSDFTLDSSNQFRNALMSLLDQGAQALILDYRNNGGGIMGEAVQVLSMFVPKGTEVVSMRGRIEENNAVFVTQNEPVDTDIPIVVLVNSGSASAAEIVAGAIQDLDRGVLMGRRTFGKGLVQSTRPLSDDTFIKLTTAKYYLPSGRCIQAIDYASRREDGSISHVPDSLVNEFRTSGGRPVFDGGGVSPDITLPAEYVSRFAMILYAKGYINDFADMYSKSNQDKGISLQDFRLTESDYGDFIAFMEDKDIEWESETGKLLRQLSQKARDERYYDAIQEQIRNIEANLSDDKQTNLLLHRGEISELIENAILLRRFYAEGVTQRNAHNDPEIARAIELLSDTERYRAILDGTVTSDASIRRNTTAEQSDE